MLNAVLVRFNTDDQGTSGVLKVGDFTCYTFELGWYNNINDFSCIPEGDYKCVYTLSPRMRKKTYEVLNVPKRGGIRIHSANYAGDSRKGFKCHLHGCIAPGKVFYGNGKTPPLSNQRMIGTSAPTVLALENYLSREPFMLKVMSNFKGD